MDPPSVRNYRVVYTRVSKVLGRQFLIDVGSQQNVERCSRVCSTDVRVLCNQVTGTVPSSADPKQTLTSAGQRSTHTHTVFHTRTITSAVIHTDGPLLHTTTIQTDFPRCNFGSVNTALCVSV